MADVKISELPVASSISDSDVVVINQGGQTKTAARSLIKNTGTVTSVTAGTGLSGGTITDSGTVSVNYGSTSTTACAGNDSRLSNARTPTAHKSTHATGGTDVLAPADIGAAPIDSATLTGVPTSTTAAAGTNTTQIATTAFVQANKGDRYLTNSTSSNSISLGGKTFTVESGLSYTPTQDITMVANLSNHMHGQVTSYIGSILSVNVTDITGTGTFLSWTINVGGVIGGTALQVSNNLSDVASTSAALTNIGGVPTSRSITAGTGLTGGGDLTSSRSLAVSYGIAAGTAAEGNDSRLSDSRTPISHASTHASGGSDPITVTLTSQVSGTLPITSGGTGATTSLVALTNLGAAASANVQMFAANGTWTKPTSARLVVFDVIAGGGGGGAGGKFAAGQVVFGAGGGGGGGYSIVSYAGADLTDASYAVAIGTAGAGAVFGVSIATAGGTSTITGAGQGVIARATGGGLGANGTQTTGTAGGAGTFTSNTGGGGNATGTGSGGSGSNKAPASGAAGGGCSTTPAAFNGGIGGSNVLFSLAGGTGGGGSSVANGGAGGAGNVKTGISSALLTGSGGGGGGASIFATGNGGNGGDGAGYGTGGGGGGSVASSGNGGNGGNGAPGIVMVTTYF